MNETGSGNISFAVTNKACLKDQSAELATLVSHRSQAVVTHIFNPSTRRQRQMDLCEFKATLSYTRLNQSKRKTELTPLILTLGVTCL